LAIAAGLVGVALVAAGATIVLPTNTNTNTNTTTVRVAITQGPGQCFST
jgi:hypothetical protein